MKVKLNSERRGVSVRRQHANRRLADALGRENGALEQLKERLLKAPLAAARDGVAENWLKRAADEAASMAWATPYPLLVLPELMTEKLTRALIQARRQQDITLRSMTVLSLTA